MPGQGISTSHISPTRKYITHFNDHFTVVLEVSVISPHKLPSEFVVMNLVCDPKERNLSIYQGLQGAWKHIRKLQ